ncbi:MAG TPA: hypothetical protein VH913_14145 [Hyphomicrobiaceae bacterium]|jgi:hypothetical protein
MIATLAPLPPEEPLDDSTPEERLGAALRVHGGDVLEYAGQLSIEQRRDGTISRSLWRDIKRAVARLNEAVTDFAREKPANG